MMLSEEYVHGFEDGYRTTLELVWCGNSVTDFAGVLGPKAVANKPHICEAIAREMERRFDRKKAICLD